MYGQAATDFPAPDNATFPAASGFLFAPAPSRDGRFFVAFGPA